jgi:hypothetical protein
MEPTVIETSIGLLCVQVEGRDWFTLQSPRPYGEVWPYVSLTLWRRDDSCELESKPWYDVEPGKEPMKKGPMPPALVEEFLKVGTDWANAHPEEFEKAARAGSSTIIFSTSSTTLLTSSCGYSPTLRTTSAKSSTSPNSRITPRRHFGAASRRKHKD